MKEPRNATHKSKGNNPTYYQKVQGCRAYRQYSVNTGKLLNTLFVFNDDGEQLIEIGKGYL